MYNVYICNIIYIYVITEVSNVTLNKIMSHKKKKKKKKSYAINRHQDIEYFIKIKFIKLQLHRRYFLHVDFEQIY